MMSYGGQMSVQPAMEVPSSKVELRVALRELISLDILSKSDPCVQFLMQKKSGNQAYWDVIGRTSVAKNAKNIEFPKSFEVNYFFEEIQELKFIVWDVDDEHAKLENQEKIGEVSTTMSDIVASLGGKLELPILNSEKPDRKNGFIAISFEEVVESNFHVNISMSAKNLDKMDTFGKSDPFVVIKKTREGDPVVVHKTEVIRKNLNPTWRTFTIPMSRLNGGDIDRILIFEVYDWDSNGDSDFIGGFEVTFRQLTEKTAPSFPLINAKKAKKKKKYQNSGILQFDNIATKRIDSFLDYIRGGCQISLCFAVDFTGSNGNPINPNSLHYLNPYNMNSYQKAISAIGSVVAPYDSDGMIPAWGFGAKLPNGRVSHFFPLNMNQQNPELMGVQGVLQAYAKVLPTVGLYGPTNFSPTVNTVANVARAADKSNAQKMQQQYQILVIITDGVITDFEQTILSVIEASSLPLSIIIVGVGKADFSKMDRLDSDEGPLRSGAQTSMRDIIQFVPFDQFASNPGQLAAETLKEVPGQLLEYMKIRGLRPNQPPQQPMMQQQQPMMQQQQPMMQQQQPMMQQQRMM